MIREVLNLPGLKSLAPDEAAALLFVRHDAGASASDAALLDEWLAADAAHIEAWAQACSAWRIFDEPIAGDESFDELRQEALAVRPSRTQWVGIAASIALVAAIGGTMSLNTRPDPASPGRNVRAAAAALPSLNFTTVKGQQRTYVLPDATIVTLNTDSAIDVAFRPGGVRRVTLSRGQAYFEVAHDPSRPFIVNLGDRTVTAVGTAFEARLDDQRIVVVLVKGRVIVDRPSEPAVNLRAGQQLIASVAGVTVSPADVSAVADWRRGVITFKDTSLASAVRELNRYSDMRLTVHDAGTSRLAISGIFRTDDPQRFARTVANIYPVQVNDTKGGEIRLSDARK